MPEPVTTCDRFLDCVRKSKLVDSGKLTAYLDGLSARGADPTDPRQLAAGLVKEGLLSTFQAGQLLQGRWRNFVVGKYVVLEPLGAGGMSKVYLCEHRAMGHRVALKVLPLTKDTDPSMVERFRREARAIAALNHPNVVRAHDIDQKGNEFFYITMEYVDGVSLHDLVKKHGPLDPARAAHYIAQAADGLQHIYEAGLVHRDLKPANLLLDRSGTVKILDLGLARFTHKAEDNLTHKYDQNVVLGTADYLSPEQALSSSAVDIRSDIYSLGATLYFLLAGRAPFEAEGVSQKLMCHQFRDPTPVDEVRPEIPRELAAVVEAMLAKQAGQRFQTPAEVIEALAPWTEDPVPPPAPEEIPDRHGGTAAQATSRSTVTPTSGPAPSRLPAPGSSRVSRPAPAQSSRTRLQGPQSSRTRMTGKNGPTSSARVLAADQAPEPARRIPVAALAGGGAALALLVALAVWRPWKSAAPDAAVPGTNPAAAKAPTAPAAANYPSPADLPPPPPGSLVVAAEGPGQLYPTVAAALAAAPPGQKTRILIRNPVHRENLELGPATLADVAIESGFPHAPVTWEAAADGPEKPLLDLNGVEGLKVRGIRFDGRQRTPELIRVRGRCPDLVIEDAEAIGFTYAGVSLTACTGLDARPVTVRRLRVYNAGDSAAGVLLAAGAPHQNISLNDNRFEGPLAAAVAVAGPVSALDVRRNRFWRLRHGIHYRPAGTPTALGLRVRGNTFAEVTSGLEFAAGPPPGEPDSLLVMDNLFVQVGHLALLSGVPLMPDGPTPPWVWYPEFEANKTSIPAASRFFRKTFTLPAKPAGPAILNIGCDESFTVWVNGKEVGHSTHKFFSQRVYAFDVSAELKPGPNVIAVEAANELDPFARGFGTAAALMVELTDGPLAENKVLLTTDTTWKAATERADGWEKPGFADDGWPAVRAWGATAGVNLPWRETVWDSVVDPHLRGQSRPIRVTVGGNARDYLSMEGYPVLESKRTATKIRNEMLIGLDPTDDARFLRYSPTSPLGTGGTQQGPIGAPPAGS